MARFCLAPPGPVGNYRLTLLLEDRFAPSSLIRLWRARSDWRRAPLALLAFFVPLDALPRLPLLVLDVDAMC